MGGEGNERCTGSLGLARGWFRNKFGKMAKTERTGALVQCSDCDSPLIGRLHTSAASLSMQPPPLRYATEWLLTSLSPRPAADLRRLISAAASMGADVAADTMPSADPPDAVTRPSRGAALLALHSSTAPVDPARAADPAARQAGGLCSRPWPGAIRPGMLDG